MLVLSIEAAPDPGDRPENGELSMHDYDSSSSDGALKIGAVARLSGVSVHTLRKWEERYGAVEPRRTDGGERLYSRTDLERLGLIKRLADAGVSLRDVARLPADELAKVWSEVASAAKGSSVPSVQPVTVAILGSGIAATAERDRSGRLRIVARASTPYDLAGQLEGRSADVLLFECPAIRSDTHAAVHDCLKRIGARAAVVVYRFAARNDLLALQAPDITTLRGPCEPASLVQAAMNLIHPGVPTGDRSARTGADSDVPPPRFSRETIARVAHSTPRIRCECPHHLADLILSLRAFEDYSAQCEDRNPADAALHNFLWRSAGQARALFEEAIAKVAEAEGLELTEQRDE